MAKTVGLTDAELNAVKSTWALVMSTNVADTAAGLLLAYTVQRLSLSCVYSLFHLNCIQPQVMSKYHDSLIISSDGLKKIWAPRASSRNSKESLSRSCARSHVWKYMAHIYSSQSTRLYIISRTKPLPSSCCSTASETTSHSRTLSLLKTIRCRKLTHAFSPDAFSH